MVRPPVAAIRAQLQELSQLFPTLVRLLAEGEPVSADRLAAAGAMAAADARAQMASHPRVERDRLGRIAGLGVTLTPTPHSFTFDGGTVYGPRATDTLLFPVILGRAGVVESRCPIDGLPVRVDVTPDAVRRVDPAEAMASELRAAERVACNQAEICGLGRFFATRESATWWLAQQPEGMIHTIDVAFEIRRQIAIELGWAAQNVR
jgi:alkylmercury lyase